MMLNSKSDYLVALVRRGDEIVCMMYQDNLHTQFKGAVVVGRHNNSMSAFVAWRETAEKLGVRKERWI